MLDRLFRKTAKFLQDFFQGLQAYAKTWKPTTNKLPVLVYRKKKAQILQPRCECLEKTTLSDLTHSKKMSSFLKGDRG